MERVERLVDDESRIVLHVVQICCARSDISLGATLAALPEFAVRIIVKFQADNKGILKAHLAGKAPRGSIIPGFRDGDFGVAQRTRDQRRRFMLQVQEPPDSLTVETRLCHVDRTIAGVDRGKLSSPESSRLVIGHPRATVEVLAE